MNARIRILAPLALIFLVGCERNLINGRVLDVQGETLPGVAVHVEGTEYQALTGPLGKYTIEYNPGPITLDFIKSGYTPGRLELTVNHTKRIEATDVSLWRLPERWGVYLVQDARYIGAKPIEPDAFATVGGTTVYGIKNIPDISTTNPTPMIVSYKLPRNEVRFCRMAPTEIELQPSDARGLVTKGKGQKMTVWTSAVKIPVTVSRIDEPEGLLLQIHYHETLKPGCYAVHWGALQGRFDLDKRIFCFNIAAPSAPTQPAAPPPGKKSKKKTSPSPHKKTGAAKPPAHNASGL